MTNLRIGNDIIVKWALVMKGTSDPFILSGKNVSLYLRGVTGKKKIEDFSVAGNTITWTFYGKDQKHTGVYSLILVVNEGVEGMVTTDACNFVNLVSCSCKTGGSDDCGVYTETIELTSTIEYVAGEGGSYDDTEIRKELANKVDKEAGKGLSSNDYTTEDKVKLDGLENYDDSELSRELTELSAEVGGLSEEMANKQDVYVAEYGVTTREQIKAAWEANKHIVCVYGNKLYNLTNYGDVYDIYFACVYYSVELLMLSVNGVWGRKTIAYEDASHKVTSLSSASTDTQYPSAKAVYDFVNNALGIIINGDY